MKKTHGGTTKATGERKRAKSQGNNLSAKKAVSEISNSTILQYTKCLVVNMMQMKMTCAMKISIHAFASGGNKRTLFVEQHGMASGGRRVTVTRITLKYRLSTSTGDVAILVV